MSMRSGAMRVVMLGGLALAACAAPEPALSSTEQLAVVLSTTTIAFGPVEVGTAVLDLTFTVSPPSSGGPSLDMITAVTETCADFSVEGPVPAKVERTCTFVDPGPVETSATGGGESDAVCPNPQLTIAGYSVGFAPVSAGNKVCTLVLEGSFGSKTVLLTGTGVAPKYSMRVSPASINFGDVHVATPSAAAVVTVLNNGAEALPVRAIMLSGGGAFALQGANTGQHVLPPDATDVFTVTCQPPNTNQHAGAIAIVADNVPTAMITLACRGTESELVANPLIVGLATRQFEPIERDVSIKNVGNEVATITSYTVEGNPELSLVTPGAIGPLPPGVTTTARVRYEAATEYPNGDLGTLTVHEVGGTNAISIAGAADPTEVSVDPGVVEFGAVCAGQTVSRSVTVSANLAGSFELQSIGAPGTPFALEAAPGTPVPGTALGHHKSELALTARFTPDARGEVTANALLRTDAPMTKTKLVVLQGEALAPGVSASPSELDFLAVNPSTFPPGKMLRLTNCDAAPLEVTGARIEGADAADFGIASPSDPHTTIQPTQHAEYLIVMLPGEPGSKEARLVIEHASGTTEATLVGTTLGETSDDRRATYYQCSASGGAAGAWPIAVALAWLAARRRRRQ